MIPICSSRTPGSCASAPGVAKRPDFRADCQTGSSQRVGSVGLECFCMFLYVSVCFCSLVLGFLCFLLWPLAAKLAAVMQCLQSCARQTFAVSIVYHQRWGSVEAVTHLLKSAGKGFVTDTVLRFCMLLGESRLQPFRAEGPDVVCHH